MHHWNWCDEVKTQQKKNKTKSEWSGIPLYVTVFSCGHNGPPQDRPHFPVFLVEEARPCFSGFICYTLQPKDVFCIIVFFSNQLFYLWKNLSSLYFIHLSPSGTESSNKCHLSLKDCFWVWISTCSQSKKLFSKSLWVWVCGCGCTIWKLMSHSSAERRASNVFESCQSLNNTMTEIISNYIQKYTSALYILTSVVSRWEIAAFLKWMKPLLQI